MRENGPFIRSASAAAKLPFRCKKILFTRTLYNFVSGLEAPKEVCAERSETTLLPAFITFRLSCVLQ